MSAPKVLEQFIGKAREFNARPDSYTYQGVGFHTIRGLLPHPNLLRWKIAPKHPALAGNIIRRAFSSRLLPALQNFKPDVVLLHDGVSLGRLVRHVHDTTGLPWGVIEQDALELDPASPLGRDYAATLKSAHAIWFLAERYAKHARQKLGLPQARVMFNGTQFPTHRQCTTPRPQDLQGRKIILCVGTFVPRKGHDILVRGFAKAAIPGGLLMIVGNPPPPALSQLVTELGLADRVRFIDYMAQEQLPQYMVWADLFALTSWDEPFGMVYTEALAAETPVVMCEDCGLAPFIEPGKHGWVVPVRDVEATAAALRQAFSPDCDLAAMGRNGKQLVQGRFTWENSARQLVEGLQA